MSSNSFGDVSTPVLPIGPGAACDVHQDIDAAKRVLRLGGSAFALLGVGQIAGNDDRFGAGSARFLGNRFDRDNVASEQRELRALGGERQGDRRAHPFGRARDHRDAAFEIKVHEL